MMEPCTASPPPCPHGHPTPRSSVTRPIPPRPGSSSELSQLSTGVVPVTRKVLADSETPLSAYEKLAGNRPGTFLLESAENGRSWSRWSFIGVGSPAALTVVDGEAAWYGNVPAGAPAGGDPIDALGATLELLRSERLPDLPPLTGGMVRIPRLRRGAAPREIG